ncbi:MAG: hypothetical protein AAGJ97_15170, partial [Planctomycetota bacterium]
SYFITGSSASIYFGEPRLTNDVDIVAEVATVDAAAFAAEFPPPEYYCSVPMIREAARRLHQFNVIHHDSGYKIDVIFSKDTLFDRSRFTRRRQIEFEPGVTAWFATPEDVVLKKLDFYREGRSEKHIRDIVGVLRVQGDDFDRAYGREWARTLGLSDLWEKVIALADAPATE